VTECFCCGAGLLSCYYQPRADDLLGTYYYQSVSSITDTQRHEDVADADVDVSAGAVDVVGLRQRVVIRRLLVLAGVCLVLAVGVLCRLLA